MSTNDGGAAFPHSNPGRSDGMSLRAYLAGQALEGLIAYPGGQTATVAETASYCVEYADALIAALSTP